MNSKAKVSIIYTRNHGFMGHSPYGVGSQAGALEKIVRWPCLLARLFGYWPFYRQNGLLRFKWFHTGPFFSLITSAAIMTACVCINTFRKKMYGDPVVNKLFKQSSTEELGRRIVVAFQTIAVFFLQLAIVYNRNGIAKVYNDLRTTFEQVLRLESTDGRVIAHVQKRVRTALLTCIVTGLAKIGMALAMALPLPFQLLDFWEACAYAVAYGLWNFLMITISAWLVVLYALILVISASFEILLAQGSSSSTPACRKMYGNAKNNNENVIQLGRRLREIVEDFNEHFKVPLVGIFILMIVIMTISIFFAANNMDQGLHSLVCALTFALYMIVFYLLCSAGEELVRHSTRYGEILSTRAEEGPNSFQIQYESLKMTTEPPAVSPGQYCTLRSQLLSSIIGVLTSYSIILVQFNTNEEQSASC